MKDQTVFTEIVEHLRRQGCRSVYSILKEPCGPYPGSLITRLEENIFLISEMQRLHDGSEPEDWEMGFARIALDYNLIVPWSIG